MTKPAQEKAPATVCDFCGLPLPAKAVEGKDDKHYCCPGCAHLDQIMGEVGSQSDKAKQVLSAARQKGLISGDSERKQKVELSEQVREEKRLHIGQMTCPSCAWLLESVLESTDGVASCEVDFYSDTAKIQYDLTKTSVDSIQDVIVDSGYSVSILEEKSSKAERMDVIRLALAFFIAMNQMMLSWVGYNVLYKDQGDLFVGIVAWIQLVTAIPVVSWCAMPIYKRAIAAIGQGKVVMETLLSIGVLSSALISVLAFITSQPHLYLETSTMLVALSLSGRWLEGWIKKKTAGSLTDLIKFSPNKARSAKDMRFHYLDEFSKGDLVIVEEQEKVPFDLVAQNRVSVNESLLTGESRPREKEPGSVILAGCSVVKGTLKGKIERHTRETVATKIKNRVMESLRNVDSGSRLADRIAQGFVPLVILVAAIAFFMHLFGGKSAFDAAFISISVLVVTCPCAFGVAASSALSLTVLNLVKKGVIVKEPSLMEKSAELNLAAFDKTGTITMGELEIVKQHWFAGAASQQVINALAAIEQDSRHPVASLIRELAVEEKLPRAEAVVELAGQGITGTVEGQRYAIGKLVLFDEPATPYESPAVNVTRVWFGIAGEKPMGYIDSLDQVRPEAREVLAELKSRGITTALLSGDDDTTTQNYASELGFDFAAGDLTPEQKREFIEKKLAGGEKVCFTGDGFNDADALATADIGFAMANSADLAMITAPVILSHNDLRGLTYFLKASEQAGKVLTGNFIWAFAYNLILIPVAAVGWLAPVYAALLMALSSLSVGMNSMRLNKLRM